MSNCRHAILRKSLAGNSVRIVKAGRSYSQFAEPSQIPDDPDILTTQDLESLTPDADSQVGLSNGEKAGVAKQFPRLQYHAPALGVNPAYDLALDVIKKDRASALSKYYITNQRIKKLNTDPGELSPLKQAQIRDMKLFAKTLRELADLNDPEVHWRHLKGDADFSLPVYRRLAQIKWSQKPLHLLMQRVTQMSVTPDVIPMIAPKVDVRLKFPDRLRGPRKGQFEVGEFLNSSESATMPQIEIQQYHDNSGLYSVAIVDPDVPNEETDSYTNYLHYLRRDVSLTCTDHELHASNGSLVHDYIPPHPHKGSNYHRYVVIVWEQPQKAPQPNAPLAGHNIPREAFDAQSFAQQNGLHAVGINFWRQVWDAKVADLMQQYPGVGYVEKEFKRIKA